MPPGRSQELRAVARGRVEETATRANRCQMVFPIPRAISNEATPAAVLIADISMGRDPRPNIPGATYHVMNRGNRKEAIFEDDRDRRQFLRILIGEQAAYGVKTLGGTQMGNHFHLAVLTPHGNLSEFMAQLEGQFARYSNWRHRRVGHLFQGRFRHVLIENDVHLLIALSYIFINPVAAGLSQHLEGYKWSTYAATAGYAAVPSYLSIDWLETLFPHLSLRNAQQRLRQILSEPKPVACYLREMELHVSSATIHQVVHSYTGRQLAVSSLPRVYRTALRPSLETLLITTENERSRFVRDSRVLYGYRIAEIARALGLKPDTVSKIFCADRRRQARLAQGTRHDAEFDRAGTQATGHRV